MTNLFQLLPFLSGWRWTAADPGPKSLGANNIFVIEEVEGRPGWVLGAGETIKGENGKKTEIRLEADAFKLDTTPESQFEAGLTGRGNFFPEITRYDTDNNIFNLAFEFAYPIPFNDRVNIEIIAPENNDIILQAAYAIIEIYNQEEFLSSVAKLQSKINQGDML